MFALSRTGTVGRDPLQSPARFNHVETDQAHLLRSVAGFSGMSSEPHEGEDPAEPGRQEANVDPPPIVVLPHLVNIVLNQTHSSHTPSTQSIAFCSWLRCLRLI